MLAQRSNTEANWRHLAECYPQTPQGIRALAALAWMAFEAQDYAQSAARFESYLPRETDPPRRARAQLALAEACCKTAQWSRCLSALQPLVSPPNDADQLPCLSGASRTVDPSIWASGLFYQAICYQQTGRTDRAIDSLTRLLATVPNAAIADRARVQKAQWLIDCSRFAEALRALDGVGGVWAERAQFDRALARYRLGEHEASARAFDQFRRRWPRSAFAAEALWMQGCALRATGQTEAALALFGELMHFSSEEQWIHRANLEMGRTQTDPAQKLASFQRVALLADPRAHAQWIALALFESLPLYLELHRPDALLRDADRLNGEFAQFGRVDQIARLKERAQRQRDQQIAREGI